MLRLLMSGLRHGLALVVAAMLPLLASCGGEEGAGTPAGSGSAAVTDVAMQNVEATSFVVSWRTGVPTDGAIAVGTSRDDLSREVPVRALTTYHRTTVDGLTPQTTYYFRISARSQDGQQAQSEVHEVATTAAPQEAAAADTGYDVAIITTDMGQIVLRFMEDIAPEHAANFKRLAREGFYNGTTFHRVIPNFMIQGGDPNSKDSNRNNDGMGGPGYTIAAEIRAPHRRGSVAAARTGDQVNPQRRSSGSQFYICVVPTPFLDNQYTVFAHVIEGMDVADRIVQVPRDSRDNPITPVVMRSVTIEHRQ